MGKSEMVLSKLFSGRFLCIVAFCATACYLAVIEPSIRDAFFALAGAILRDYFTRDRSTDPKMTAPTTVVTTQQASS